MTELEQKLTELCRKHGVYSVKDSLEKLMNPKPEMLIDAVAAVKRNKYPDGGKIPAIKYLREMYPFIGLKTAKDLVDAVWDVADLFSDSK